MVTTSRLHKFKFNGLCSRSWWTGKFESEVLGSKIYPEISASAGHVNLNKRTLKKPELEDNTPEKCSSRREGCVGGCEADPVDYANWDSECRECIPQDS
jgi:hypothetical protein